MRWLFPRQEVQVDTRCLDCGDHIRLRFRDEEVLEVTPPDTVGYMTHPRSRWRAGSDAFH